MGLEIHFLQIFAVKERACLPGRPRTEQRKFRIRQKKYFDSEGVSIFIPRKNSLRHGLYPLYRNCLKNRDYAQEAPENLDSERATTPGPPKTHRLWGGAIAEWLRTLENSPGDCFLGEQASAANWPEGGTSESRNCGVKPTPAETDS